jgi:hypothetical protein
MSASTGDADAQVISAYAAIFEKRSRMHFGISYAVLALLFLLFGLTIFVFLFAELIVKPVTRVDLYRELEIAARDQGALIDTYQKQLDDARTGLNNGTLSRLDVARVEANLADAQVLQALYVEKVRLMTSVGYYSDLDTNISKEELAAELSSLKNYLHLLTIQKDLTETQTQSGMLPPGELAQVTKAAAQTKQRIDILTERMTRAQPASQIKTAAANLDTLEIVRTSLVRFGGVAATLFLMAVLVPIYRYNVRIATYYLARADALNLRQQFPSTDFGHMTTWLTPTYPFDREPRTPVDSFASAVKDTLGAVKRS